MSYQVKFSIHADNDIDSILKYISKDNPVTAINFINQLVTRIIDLLSLFPLSGVCHKDFRFMSFDNYLVVYDVNEEEKVVEVFLVSQGHREWRSILLSRK